MDANLCHNMKHSLYLSNLDLEMKLEDESKQILHQITKYIRSFCLEESEVEILRRDLIGMAMEAEKRGESLKTVIGDNISEFCDALIQEELGIAIPRGKKILRIASNLLIFKGIFVLLLLSSVVIGMILLPHQQFLEKILNILPTVGILNYYMVKSVIVGGVSLFSGMIGRKMAARPSAAKTCLALGILCVMLDIIDHVVALSTGGVIIQDVKTTILNIVIQIVYFGIPILYLVGAKKNLI